MTPFSVDSPPICDTIILRFIEQDPRVLDQYHRRSTALSFSLYLSPPKILSAEILWGYSYCLCCDTRNATMRSINIHGRSLQTNKLPPQNYDNSNYEGRCAATPTSTKEAHDLASIPGTQGTQITQTNFTQHHFHKETSHPT